MINSIVRAAAAWVKIVRTVTDLTGLDIKFGTDLTSAPASDSDAIVPALTGKITHTQNSYTGVGHLIGTLGWTIFDAAGETVPLIIGSEGKLEVLNGTATAATAAENQITDNSGTITTAILTDGQLVDNSGTITTLIGNRSCAIGTNSGTISTVYGTLFSDLSGLSGITTKYSFLGLDLEAPCLNYGGFQNDQLQTLTSIHPGIITNRYYSYPYTTLAPVALIANLIYMCPVIVPEKVTITRLGFEVTTGVASSNARIGIYKMAGGVPTSLVLDAGAVSTASTGAKEITISQFLNAGVYCLAICSDDAPTINYRVPSDSMNWLMGSNAQDDTGAAHENYCYGVHAYAALPGTFPALAYSAVQAQPHLWFRKV